MIKLRQTLARATNAIENAERNTYNVLSVAPQAIIRGKIGTKGLRNKYQGVQNQIQKIQQILNLLTLIMNLLPGPVKRRSSRLPKK